MSKFLPYIILALLMAGCSQTPKPNVCDDPQGYWSASDTTCPWHSPEAHENARRKGYVLECEGGQK